MTFRTEIHWLSTSMSVFTLGQGWFCNPICFRDFFSVHPNFWSLESKFVTVPGPHILMHYNHHNNARIPHPHGFSLCIHKMEVPPNHLNLSRNFPILNHLFWGTPIYFWTTPFHHSIAAIFSDSLIPLTQSLLGVLMIFSLGASFHHPVHLV